MNPTLIAEFVARLWEERAEQERKHGTFNATATPEQVLIATVEEVGEVAKALQELRDYLGDGVVEHALLEIVQTAALCCLLYEKLAPRLVVVP